MGGRWGEVGAYSNKNGTLYTKYEVFSTTQLAQLEECQSAERETVSSNHGRTITNVNWSQKNVGIMPFLSSVQYASLGGDVGIKP